MKGLMGLKNPTLAMNNIFSNANSRAGAPPLAFPVPTKETANAIKYTL